MFFMFPSNDLQVTDRLFRSAAGLYWGFDLTTKFLRRIDVRSGIPRLTRQRRNSLDVRHPQHSCVACCNARPRSGRRPSVR